MNSFLRTQAVCEIFLHGQHDFGGKQVKGRADAEEQERTSRVTKPALEWPSCGIPLDLTFILSRAIARTRPHNLCMPCVQWKRTKFINGRVPAYSPCRKILKADFWIIVNLVAVLSPFTLPRYNELYVILYKKRSIRRSLNLTIIDICRDLFASSWQIKLIGCEGVNK